MQEIDVICIGAINCDYMFHVKKSDKKKSNPDDNDEKLNWKDYKAVEKEVTELYRSNHNYSTQIGGSAFLTLKTIHAIAPKLRTAYVGVCGKTNEFDYDYGVKQDLKDEFDFFDDRWFLKISADAEDKAKNMIGKSVVRLYRHTRSGIKIAAGANNQLISMIEDREKENKKQNKESFVDFLKGAKWIHVSSLADFSQFVKIVEYIKAAKEGNRFLIASLDPGSEYTSDRKEELQEHIGVFDYVFLSHKEMDNLTGNNELPKADKNIQLAAYFNSKGNSDTKVIIIKNQNSHKLIDFVNGIPYIYYHRKLSFRKIKNDTGAGDCFAGGFIAGLLSDKFLSHQPFAIELGVIASETRMTLKADGDVFKEIRNAANRYINRKVKKGTLNLWQRITVKTAKYKQFAGGLITGVITTVLAGYIINGCKFLIELYMCLLEGG